MACPAALAATLAALGLAGCVEPPAPAAGGQPAMYRSMASSEAAVDAGQARDMISAYRRNKGLPPLALDAGLQQVAAAEAAAQARADRPGSADAVKARAARAGFPKAAANVSAGYHTLAEAFSGWRDSPQHDRVLRDPAATRMGIATAYAPGSKYKVYWTLVVAAGG